MGSVPAFVCGSVPAFVCGWVPADAGHDGFGGPGGDRLSRALRHSTMGAETFDGRVRDGIGSGCLAWATRPAKAIVAPLALRLEGVCFDRWSKELPSPCGSEELASTDGRRGSPGLCGSGVCGFGSFGSCRAGPFEGMAIDNEGDQAGRAISTGQLHGSPRFHTRPIDVVVFHGSSGRTRFEVGFELRCLQLLSRPHIATLHCGWRHNRSTRGAFVPVLSY